MTEAQAAIFKTIDIPDALYSLSARVTSMEEDLRRANKQAARVKDLEQKLEQAEKELADYQFNYPTIIELEKEKAELKAKYLQAKELLNDFICYANLDDCNLYIKEQAEQFLKE